MYKDSQWIYGQKLKNLGQQMVDEAHNQLAHTDFIGSAPKYLIERAEEGVRLREAGRKIQESAEKKGGVNLYYEVCIKSNTDFHIREN